MSDELLVGATTSPGRGFTVQLAPFAFTLETPNNALVKGNTLVTQVGGVAVLLKDSLIEVEGADELTLVPTGDLSA